MVALNQKKELNCYIGIDLGGTYIKYGLMSEVLLHYRNTA